MQNIVLSIIVPCFNCSDYIEKSVKSLERGNKESIEVIIVDDCSTDGSYERLMAYKKSSRLNLNVVKNDSNLGPGPSRNVGISIAKGKYITFLDADDFFSDVFLQGILPLLRFDYDCIVFDYNIIGLNGHSERFSSFYTKMPIGIVEKKEAAVFVKGSTCCKIYKKEKTDGIYFLNQRRNEDMPFTKSVVLNCDRVYYQNEAYYNYVMRGNSLMHDATLYSENNARRAIEYISSSYENMYPDEVEAIFAHEFLCSVGQNSVKTLNRKEWIQHIKEIESLYPSVYENIYVRRMPKHVYLTVKGIHLRLYLVLLFIKTMKRRIKHLKGRI